MEKKRGKRNILKFESRSRRDTKNIAIQLADILKKEKVGRHARVFGLVGNLGAGKTTFTREFLRALGVRGGVTSPTFVLVRRYGTKKGGGVHAAYHIDAYRLRGAKELGLLGWKEILVSPHHLVLVEWADRVKRAMPKHTRWIVFTHKGGNKREVGVGPSPK